MEEKEFKGDLEGFPKEVVEVMLNRQEDQGNPRNVSIFEKSRVTGRSMGGFDWHKTIEGDPFWNSVIVFKNFEVFFYKYGHSESKKDRPFTNYDNGNHVMIDIETLGTGVLPVVAQISAIRFNPVTGDTFEEFNEYVDIVDCMREGLTIEKETLEWWNSQPEKIRNKVLYDSPEYGIRLSIKTVIESFNEFLSEIENVNVWGKGPSFDCTKISNISDKFGLKKRSYFWQNRICIKCLCF